MSRGKINSIYNIKKEQIMVDTNEPKKPEAIWQTLRLSFVSYDEYFGFSLANLIFRSLLSKPCGLNWPAF